MFRAAGVKVEGGTIDKMAALVLGSSLIIWILLNI